MNRVRVKSPGTAKAVLDAVTLPDVLISAVLLIKGAPPTGDPFHSLFVYSLEASFPLIVASLFLFILYWSRVQATLKDLRRRTARENPEAFGRVGPVHT